MMARIDFESERFPKLSKWALRGGSLVAFALSWEVIGRTINSLLLPTCSEMMPALVRLLGSEELWRAVWISNQAMVLGFALAAAIGIPLGLLMGRWHSLERSLDPYLSILLVTSKSALIPIVIMATGLGLLSRVLVVFLFAVVVITVNVRAGLHMVDPAWVEMARSFGATEGQLWHKILLRGAFPAILTGLRLGLARSISGMVSAELLLVALGIGRLMLHFQGTFDAASLYATILVVVAEAIALLQACRGLERRLTLWAGEGVVI